MTSLPDDDDEWSAQHDAALAQVAGRRGDNIARALDLLGWQITPKPGVEAGRWPIEKGACPSWAEPSPSRQPSKPTLVKGGKPSSAEHSETES